MFRLYGFALSNYYNKVKLALLEKGVPFEEELVWADRSAALMDKSPLGKIPYCETEHGALFESQVIMEYIEDAYPRHPLMPVQVIALIHWQALRLWVKRVPFHHKPPFEPGVGSARR